MLLSVLIGLLFLLHPVAVSASLLHLEGPVPTDLAMRGGPLAGCATEAHCRREEWAVSDPRAALEGLLPAVLALDGVSLLESRADYLHATLTSRLFGFVDDLELHADAARGVLEARSVSRLGDSDLGVNARRLATLHQALIDAAA
jgi:uncharacterized protein (DUF1499 family)